MPIPPPEPQVKDRVLAVARREPRLATHERVWELRGQGCSRQAIARHLGIHCSTVFPLGALLRSRHLRSEVLPERKRRGDAGHSLLDPWQHVVLEHWNSGRRHGRQMFRALQQDGCRGSYPTLARYLGQTSRFDLQRLRAAQGIVVVRKSAKQPRPVLADSIYNRVAAVLACFLLGLTLLIIRRIPGTKGFVVLPRRWVVEQTFGWLGRWRRLSKDYERLPEVSEAMVTLAMIRLMVHRTVHPNRKRLPAP